MSDLIAEYNSARDYFEDKVEFTDDVHGSITLNQLERDCIDSPEFQRLFRISQLGFADLLYHTANHTRGIHSIGACAKAKELVDHLNKNTPKIERARRQRNLVTSSISFAERCLISLAGLLHDLPHGPLSHDIEKKTHYYDGLQKRVRSHYGPYEKHDNFKENPALYLMIFDRDHSILARVLRHHSPFFWQLLKHEALLENGRHFKPFVEAVQTADWEDKDREILPSLLFHLLVFEDLSVALNAPSVGVAVDFKKSTQEWGIGPRGSCLRELHKTWYQPYRHDIVGNTLSADLLDYLSRDAQRLGMRSSLDVKLLEFYVLVDVPPEEIRRIHGENMQLACSDKLVRCAIDLNDYKRDVIRPERINDVFRLLDRRQEIHEKAIFHRVVQSAIAMMARAVALTANEKPGLETLYGIGSPQHALHGDDLLLKQLISLTSGNSPHRAIAQKLIERRVYRPLMIVPGDRAHDLLTGTIGYAHSSEKDREETLRLLGAILDSTYFAPLFCLVCWCVERLLDHSFESTDALDEFIEKEVCQGERSFRDVVPRRVILWATPYKQLYKDPALIVRVGEKVGRLDILSTQTDTSGSRLPPSILTRLRKGLEDAESKYAAMWKIYVFISDGLYYTGGLARVLPDHSCRRDREAHKQHLMQAEACIVRAIQVAWYWWATQSHRTNGDLNGEISDSDLRRILKIYTAHVPYARKGVSGVDLGQYLHLESDEHCRDIRYRFDRPSDLPRCLKDAQVSQDDEASIREFLRLAKVDLKEIEHEELSDIVSHVAKRIQDLDAEIHKAARVGVTLDPNSVRRVWLQAEIESALANEGTDDDGTRNETQGNGAVSRGPGSRELGERRERHRRDRQVGTPALRVLSPADSTVGSSGKISDPKTPSD